ncbi:MAG: hypothetical protein D6160_20505 [Ketobacter sp.]|nr:MAG: hypothetical protein D6160_20505 [Ketobacter sp.]
MNATARFSPEEQNLFNPAYCSLILYEAIRQFQGDSDEGMPCTLAYLALPMSSNGLISSCLPNTVATPISAWITSNEGELVGLAGTISSYVDITTTAIGFLLDQGVVVLSDTGRLSLDGQVIPKMPGFVAKNTEIKRNFRVAGFIGRWFTSASSVESIYTQLGVRP